MSAEVGRNHGPGLLGADDRIRSLSPGVASAGGI